MPLVSFLIVAHNARPFLWPCITSVFGQTHRRIEVVLVDNASTDGAVDEVAREFAGSHAMRLVRSETNRGPSGGAMLGLPHCRGEFVARIDADDIALSGRIERQVRYLQAHPEKIAVGGDVLRIDAVGNPLGIGLSLRGEFMRRHAAKWYIGCFHTTLLVRRSALVARGYNPTLFAAEDYELIESIAARGQLGLVPYIVTLYRQHDASIRRRFKERLFLCGSEVISLLSGSVGRPSRRSELEFLDFGYLAVDDRLRLSAAERSRWFEDSCLRNRDWLGAAYFASINGRWLQFGGCLIRAAFGGSSSGREIFALFVCRAFWPVWLRMTNARMALLKPLMRTRATDPIEDGLSLANLVNGLRISGRIGGAGAALMVVCYFGLKPSPSAHDVPWLPRTATYYIDHHNFLFNVAGFFVATAVVQFCLDGLTGDSRWACWRRSAYMAGLTAGIEIMQIFLPTRVFDLMDIAAGWLGVLLATWAYLPHGRSARSAVRAKLDAITVTPIN